MTYSIVARDPETGALGCAVQSHFFSVGSTVPWVEPGLGAVATQALTEPSYGRGVLAGMQRGDSPQEVLEGLLSADPQREHRQVIGIDGRGRVAAHTGARCIAEAGHRSGDQAVAAANLMRHPGVPDAMMEAYRTAHGDLAARLLAAQRAAEAHGGDLRGRQSAAIVIASGVASGKLSKDRIFDLRVEDHPDPVVELERLVRLRRAYRSLERGDEELAADDLAAARASFRRASELAPELAELDFWAALSLYRAGERSEAMALFHRACGRGHEWTDLLGRLVEAGYLPDDGAGP